MQRPELFLEATGVYLLATGQERAYAIECGTHGFPVPGRPAVVISLVGSRGAVRLDDGDASESRRKCPVWPAGGECVVGYLVLMTAWPAAFTSQWPGPSGETLGVDLR